MNNGNWFNQFDMMNEQFSQNFPQQQMQMGMPMPMQMGMPMEMGMPMPMPSQQPMMLPTQSGPTQFADPRIAPTQQYEQINMTTEVVPHVLPSHLTTINRHMINHQYHFPHTESCVNECCETHTMCGHRLDRKCKCQCIHVIANAENQEDAKNQMKFSSLGISCPLMQDK